MCACVCVCLLASFSLFSTVLVCTGTLSFSVPCLSRSVCLFSGLTPYFSPSPLSSHSAFAFSLPFLRLLFSPRLHFLFFSRSLESSSPVFYFCTCLFARSDFFLTSLISNGPPPPLSRRLPPSCRPRCHVHVSAIFESGVLLVRLCGDGLAYVV